MKFKFLKYIILFCSCIIIYSCNKTAEKKETELKTENKAPETLSSAGVKENGIEFRVEYEAPRKFYKIEKEDLNNDGYKEVIVFSVHKDTAEKYNDYYNFDLFEVFSLDNEKKKYVKILSDTVDYSTDYSFEDLEKNGYRQLLISTNSGGNDAVVSKGMFIYSMKNYDKPMLIKYFDTGDPVIEDIKNDGTKEILIKDEYWGVMPQVNVINFISGIYNFENNNLVLKNSDHGEFYEDKLAELKDKYYGIKRKVEMGMQMSDMSYPLYREAAEVIINYYAKGDMKGLKKFWDEEKDDLEKNIPQDEFNDLNNFIKKALPADKNA